MLEIMKLNIDEIKINAKNLARKYDWSNIAEEFIKLFADLIKKNNLKG